MEYVTAAIIGITLLETPAPAQDTAVARANVHLMAHAVPVLTRATPTAARRSLTEAYLSQPMLMFTADRGPLHANGTLNFEGLTMARGELTTGAHGEGYVDRRHPHAYVHELMVGASHPWSEGSASLFLGRGFVPFGSDDPMVRPFQKYPANHHLAQILERLVAVGAVRRGPFILEASAFNGDEPTSAGSEPRYDRFADSWAGRFTWVPAQLSGSPLELSVSAANVVSPEVSVGGGLDQLKHSAVARWRTTSADRDRYLLAEWARTKARSTFGRPAGAYQTWLVEGAVCRSGPRLAARLERTDRPEEERLIDPFRSPNPPGDNSTHGVTQWTTGTVAISTSIPAGIVRARPFVEAALAVPKSLLAGSVFDPHTFYGSSRLGMLSAGITLTVGVSHGRMGRYGAGLDLSPEADDHAAMGHVMNPGVISMAQPWMRNRCAE